MFSRKTKGTKLANGGDPLINDGDNEMTSMSHQDDYPDEQQRKTSYDQFGDNSGKKTTRGGCSLCSWKCACLTTSLTCSLITLTLLLVTFLSIAPNFAQSTLNNASMDIINGSISNPTNESITMTSTIALSNAGMFP